MGANCVSILKVSIRQVKAARALAGWSQEDLAEASGISMPTIKRLEAADGEIGGRPETGAALVSALEKAGVEFIAENGGGEEAIRKRRATANRVLTMLKAMLNFSFDEGHVSNRDAWGRKLKPFHGVDAARIRYLSITEAQRLLNACDPIFRPLARAPLETGCRYSELARLDISDFNTDAGAIAIRKSKSGKSRHVILTEDGAEFFRTHCAGKTGAQIMFPTSEGERFKTAEQKRPMEEASDRAKIEPRVSFHILRHTWASHAVMNGVPLLVVAKNLGHKDTRMVEIHYSHLAPSFIVDAIRAGAPKFGIEPDRKVVRIS